MGFPNWIRVRSEALTRLLFAATPQGPPAQVNSRLQYLYFLAWFGLLLATEHPGNARFVVAPPAF